MATWIRLPAQSCRQGMGRAGDNQEAEMTKASKLFYGKIPAKQECPFRERCGYDKCAHKGKEHNVMFSCGFARAFDLLDRYETTESKQGV